ncbi:hypothetical protein DM450_14795 [Sphingomonas sp. IC081]|nr:hypothetical protein DM450_14795 [Sphingomonas sp. IC081]
MPYGYYQFLRLIVTGYAAYVSYVYFRRGPSQWGWAFGTVALLYNPMFVITMSKEFHTVVNLAVAGLVLFEFYRLRGGAGPTVIEPDVVQESSPLADAANPTPASGGFLRVVSPPLLALVVGTAVIAVVSYVKSQPSTQDTGFTQPEISPTEFSGSDDALAPLAEFPAMSSPVGKPESSEPVSTLGEFTDKVDGAVHEFSRIYKTEGLSGAQNYSRNCQAAAKQSYDILETDFCTAFDMAAVLVDHSVATDLGMPQDEYFKGRALALDGDYARFNQASQNRTEIIWQEVKSVLAPSMQQSGG